MELDGTRSAEPAPFADIFLLENTWRIFPRKKSAEKFLKGSLSCHNIRTNNAAIPFGEEMMIPFGCNLVLHISF